MIFRMILLTAACLLCSSPIHANDDASGKAAADADLAAVQGVWERVIFDGRGNIVGRATKTIQGKTETIRYFDNKGELLQAHRVEITLRRDGGVRHFEYSVIEVIAGPQKGLKSTIGGGYIYKVWKNQFIEINGASIRDEQQPLSILVWEKKETEET